MCAPTICRTLLGFVGAAIGRPLFEPMLIAPTLHKRGVDNCVHEYFGHCRDRNSYSVHQGLLRQMPESAEGFEEGMKTIRSGMDNAKRIRGSEDKTALSIDKLMMLWHFKHRHIHNQ